ncbi:MAG TPA: YkgJ family cysteine cluster protein [Anaerohalosphaeraceae bacterium]|nr:YkgJ family cysteine cluster protein [Anaerohalosphaeraceae bacterium]HOL31848.1 YkgJ family cysteine cluster protein [Anaerohalosphaeraceae bacterium]HOM75082.1 YkgJ family cysteine cluster protein [Anaerohalosphaeraceae bacterium]HPC63163.1 YkgJ family cysteine cluster protein [Anaerohalosphaeraceae bacterium]HPO68952.1 YkgJ family cysteine cluster protein [Anaerohalosphaeraceae bacterium]
MTAVEQYIELRTQVDQITAKLALIHSARMACRKGCCQCCMDLSVWPVEFYSIVEEMKAAGWPRPQLSEDKQCCFLDEQGACQIYPFRPLICRTHGLPLVYWHDETDPAGWGVMFCKKNFKDAENIEFGPDNTLNMEVVNEKLARINLSFLGERKDLNIRPEDRIELKRLF